MTDQDHVELRRAVSKLKGKGAVSGYRGELMDELYKGWNRFEEKPKKTHSVKTERTEVLWTNYTPDADTQHATLTLFEKGSATLSGGRAILSRM